MTPKHTQPTQINWPRSISDRFSSKQRQQFSPSLYQIKTPTYPQPPWHHLKDNSEYVAAASNAL